MTVKNDSTVCLYIIGDYVYHRIYYNDVFCFSNWFNTIAWFTVGRTSVVDMNIYIYIYILQFNFVLPLQHQLTHFTVLIACELALAGYTGIPLSVLLPFNDLLYHGRCETMANTNMYQTCPSLLSLPSVVQTAQWNRHPWRRQPCILTNVTLCRCAWRHSCPLSSGQWAQGSCDLRSKIVRNSSALNVKC